MIECESDRIAECERILYNNSKFFEKRPSMVDPYKQN